MKKLYTLSILILLLNFLCTNKSNAQLTGTLNIPGSYASISAAISSLNALGVGAGGVTFNVAAGYVETMTQQISGYTINIVSNPPNAGNPVVFQKSGVGANPLVLSSTNGTGTVSGTSLGSNGDAFFKFVGTDYITFDGIDVQENYTGATQSLRMEYGFLMVRASAADGCKNVTIRNCTINLLRSNIYSSGIASLNINSTGSITSPTSMAGRHENIFIYGNTVNNSFNGMYFAGYNDPVSPYNFYENNYQIGVTTANTLTNIGSVGVINTAIHYGIYAQYVDSLKISNNTIRMNTGTNNVTHYGIFTTTSINPFIDIVSNTVSDTAGGTTTQQLGISTNVTGTTNTVNIINNIVQYCRYTNSTSGNALYILNQAAPFNLNITGNTVDNCTLGGGASSSATGIQAGIYNTAGTSTSGSIYNISNNTVSNLSRTQFVGSSGTLYGIYCSASGLTLNVNNNTINNLTNPQTSSSTTAGLNIIPTITTINIYSNTISNINRTSGLSTGPLYGIFANNGSVATNTYGNTVFNLTIPSGGTAVLYGYYNSGIGTLAENFYNNVVYSLSNSCTGACIGANVASGGLLTKQVYGNTLYNITGSGQTGGLRLDFISTANVYKNHVYNITSNQTTGSPSAYGFLVNTSATTTNIYNNIIQEIKAPAGNTTTSVLGFWLNGGTTANVYYNTVYLNASSSSTIFGTAALWTVTTNTLDLRNNILINKSSPGSSSGFAVAYQRNSSTLTTYASSSNNNNFYAGTPSSNRLIYYDLTNSDQTLSAFQTRVYPRDNVSITENTTFKNTAISPYDIHVDSTVASQCESGAVAVSSPFSIADDYDGNARYPNAGYPNNPSYPATAPDIGADEFGGIPLDISPPVISYTALGNTTSTSNRSFTGVGITDIGSGVNIVPGTRPRCYYKKLSNLNTLIDNTFLTNGWKWVEANGLLGTPFDFTIDYSLLYGGAGVGVGDVIQYFVVAEDNASPSPNVGMNSGIFNSPPSGVNLISTNFPVTGSVNNYTIINSSGPLSGDYSVGLTLFNVVTGKHLTAMKMRRVVKEGTEEYYELAENGKPYMGTQYIELTKEDKIKFGLNEDVVGAFTSITAAIANLNSSGVSGNVRFLLLDASYGDVGTPESFPLTVNQITGAGPSATIKILPNTGVNAVITGNNTSAIFLFNGADYVTIDGRPNETGTPKSLTVRNTNSSATATTVTFINDATNNTLQYAVFEGAGTNASFPPAASTIYFSTSTGSTGNDNNVITNNDIRDRSDVAGYPYHAVASTGSTATSALYNSNISVLNNNIFNFRADGGNPSTGVILGSGSSDWAITGNSFYQTSTVNTATGLGWNVIMVNNSLSNNNIITGNYIGGSAPLCGGTPWTTSGTGQNTFYGIRLFAGSTTASSVQGNVISNIDHTTTPISSGLLHFLGILAQSGLVNIGTVTGNTIGATSGIDNTKIIYGGVSANTVFSRGIDMRGTGNVSNNTVGSITINGTSTGTMTFDGISFSGTPTTSVSISNNIIGSTTTAGSIRNNSTSYPAIINGISSSVATVTVTISNNTVQNITDNGTSPTSLIRGMLHSGTGISTISLNTVREISTAAANSLLPTSSASLFSATGILLTAGSSGQIVSQNTIQGIRSITSGSANTGVQGIGINQTSNTLSSTESRNRIYDLTNTSNGTGPIIYGIHNWNGSWTVTNNQITITNGETSNMNKLSVRSHSPIENRTEKIDYVNYTRNNGNNNSDVLTLDNDKLVNESFVCSAKVQSDNTGEKHPAKLNTEIDANTNGTYIDGIRDWSNGTGNFYYNSVYIGGSASTGNAPTHCYYRYSTLTGFAATLSNNLFFNARLNTGSGTGNHFSIGDNYTAGVQWSSNYNVLVSPDTNNIGEQPAGTSRNITSWRSTTLGDAQSWSTTSGNISASNLFTNIMSGNLQIQSANTEAWLVSGKGIALTGQNIDYNGDARVTTVSGGCTDIGSDEFSGAPATNPYIAAEIGSPGSGMTTSYRLWGRMLCQISWNITGTTYPSNMIVKYYSGVNPNNTLGGNYANSYWSIIIGGGSFDGKYNILMNFGDNETSTISTPSAGTILAKYESWGAWQVYPLYVSGQTTWQSQLNWANKTVEVDSLLTFSDFALTDASAPLPVMLSSFRAAVIRHDVNLMWVTQNEINNRGFFVERRGLISGNFIEQYSDWMPINSEIINGAGTTGNQQTYNFLDKKLDVGTYQYRLKQIDYNGNFVYYELNDPRNVNIGKPINFDISQNYPNPSNPKSKIDYQLPYDGKVTLKIYDILGREVSSLVDEEKEAGYYSAEFDGTNLSSGTYLYRLISENGSRKFVKTMKLVLVK